MATEADQHEQQQHVPPHVQYQEIAQECAQLMQKIAELEVDRNEHVLVEETLLPLDGDRRAYRLVGDVLVERTVKEVLPSVTSNKDNLEKTIRLLRQRLGEKQGLAMELKTKYNLSRHKL